MKIILLGSTGFIGSEVLSQSLLHPSITSLIALSRHPLPPHPKLTTIIMADFNPDSYTPEILDLMKDAEGCIWSIGTYRGLPDIELSLPSTFQSALLQTLNPSREFRYVYLGGAFTSTDQEKTLFFLPKARRLRGLAQTNLQTFSVQHPHIHAYIVRPAGVLSGDGNALLGYLLSTVSVRRLAAVMVDLAVNGDGKGGGRVLENREIIERGGVLVGR